MGNSKSKKAQKEPDKFFERERWKEQKRGEKRKKKLNPANKRTGVIEAPVPSVLLVPPPAPPGPAPPAHQQQVRSYDDEALDRMRYQLHNDSDAFLLNNILLSVQFFENYEREVHQIKNNPISERETLINSAMVRRNKHVFFADRLQECVHEHVCYLRRRGHAEVLAAPRLYVIYDNVEASEPGDTSDYSAVLDAPFYKLRIEDCKESGYVKLKKMEVLESTLQKEEESKKIKKSSSDDSIYTDSEKESNCSDESPYASRGVKFLEQMKAKLNGNTEKSPKLNINLNHDTSEFLGRRYSGPNKQASLQVEKNNISNINNLRKVHLQINEEQDIREHNDKRNGDDDSVNEKPRKSILKNTRRLSGPIRYNSNKSQYADVRNQISENTIAEDTETSGYRSNSSSRQNESSETESDYGYSTITESATPKKIELSVQSNYSVASGVLPEEAWTAIETQAISNWSDEEDDEENADADSKLSLSKNLYERNYFLNSLGFMNNFVDNFIMSLGSGLGLNNEAIQNAMTQGASIYCDTLKSGSKFGIEVFPALIAAWPNIANQWIIRERRIIQNPRTNFSYQWPTKYMVSKAIGFGCLLVPIGFRPKRGLNPDQILQWKIIFPAAERYLESCLAHSHMRCYLFTLALHKCFLENETSKIGLDASHIKNHLFWQCEDNYAKWPEDRLGETLRLFLRSFYIHFGQSRFPNYFIESCNEFKSIPKPLLMKLQRRLADILEAPVMHVLHAVDKLKYHNKDFYPTLSCHRLYEILTCKNPLRIINPNLPAVASSLNVSSDSEEDNQNDFWNNAKAHDKYYQWKKERQRQIHERRKAQIFSKKQKTAKLEREIKPNIILPTKMDAERRGLVLEFFIPHFIAMARSSEKFDAVRQAVIYLEQAQRLCMLLLELPQGSSAANEYLDVIRDKLADCQRKLVNQGGYKLPPRRESNVERAHKPNRKLRPKFENMTSPYSPVENHGIPAFAFADVHLENFKTQESNNNSSNNLKLSDAGNRSEESKL